MELFGVLLGLIGPFLVVFIKSTGKLPFAAHFLKWISLFIGILQLLIALLSLNYIDDHSANDSILFKLAVLLVWGSFNIYSYITVKQFGDR